ncbi:bud site selection protein [Linderina macrospora]|uniref:Bud site selection protein n=1 Tax=Linderina macrospora TaxID=4868 RepID=A0ACC1IZ96_9FUNG|nr:bud site selection protein [Linderina macrospora]
MILFDDLRAYTAWRSEMHNLRATGQQITFRHTQAEWEALGDLALRLRHPSEAKEAFEYALNIRFSAKAWQHLLELYSGAFSEMQAEERLRNEDMDEPVPVNSSDSLMAALDAVVWLTVYHDRWYNNMAYPNPVCEQVIRLVKTHGLSKVQNAVLSLNLKPAVYKLVARYFAIAEKFEVADKTSFLSKVTRSSFPYSWTTLLDVASISPDTFDAAAFQNAYTDNQRNMAGIVPPPHHQATAEPEIRKGGWEQGTEYMEWNRFNPTWIQLFRRKYSNIDGAE